MPEIIELTITISNPDAEDEYGHLTKEQLNALLANMEECACRAPFDCEIYDTHWEVV